MRDIVLIDPIATGAPFRAVAKSMGCRVLALYTLKDTQRCAWSSRASLYEGADDVRCVSTREEALGALNGYCPEAIIAASEAGIEYAEWLSRRLGLQGNNGPGEGVGVDLLATRAWLHSVGVKVPLTQRCHSGASSVAAAEGLGLPVHVRSSTGRSVFLCRTAAEVRHAFYACAAEFDSALDSVPWCLVEQALEGTDFAVNLFGTRKALHPIDCWSYRRRYTEERGIVDVSMMQVSYENGELPQLFEFASRICEATNQRLGPIRVDIRLTAAGPVLLRVVAAPCGPRIPELWQRHSRFQLFSATIQAFLGEELEEQLPSRRQPFGRRLAVAFSPVTRRGIVQQVNGIQKARGLASHEFSEINIMAGDVAGDLGQPSVAATFWLAAANPQQLTEDLETLENSVSFAIGGVDRLFGDNGFAPREAS